MSDQEEVNFPAEIAWAGYLQWILETTDITEAEIPREKELFMEGFNE